MTKTIILIRADEKKHSVIYKPANPQPDDPITSVYIMRAFLRSPTPERLELTLSEYIVTP